MTGVSFLNVNPLDAYALDDKLLDGERMRLLPAADLRKIDYGLLRAWANFRGRYALVTSELIEWLRLAIEGKDALEIAAGMGDIGFRLGIKQSDSRMQQNQPGIAEYYRLIGQQITIPPDDILTEEAVESVKKHKPQVAIASWLTHYSPEGDGSPYGANEEEVLRHVEQYIFIGNTRTHFAKPIMKYPHQMLRFDWLFSRSQYPQENFIGIWKGIK